MKRIAAKRKGSNFEREIARRLRAVFPEAKRGFQFRSRNEAPDVDVPHFWIECKRMRLTQPRAALADAKACAPAGRWPLAVCKDDREPAFVAMYFDDFIALLERLPR